MVKEWPLEDLATDANFTEASYLAANADVAQALRNGALQSARQHFEAFGRSERRRVRAESSAISEAKREKLERVRPLLRDDMPYQDHSLRLDFLTDDLREQFGIIDTENVSSNDYDSAVLDLIRKFDGGLILDCGSGRRSVYYENVVNFEIAPYDTTDVLGVSEELPFKDNSFDAVICIAVLEHVKDPFRSAREISRVLKKGGFLYCAVPFLQPLHAYPHHYYNMTDQGLRNLFDRSLTVEGVVTVPATLPIHTLTWFLRSWSEGLQGSAKANFLNQKVSDLLRNGADYYQSDFVKELSAEKVRELASGFVLTAHKP